MRALKLALRASYLALGLALCGCGTDYCWRSSVPESVRTVSVPTFRNESNVMEFGAVATRQLLREFQREGTFKIRPTGDAALEIQGVVRSADSKISAYDRHTGVRIAAYSFEAVVVVSVVDKRNGRILIENRTYRPQTNYTAGQDMTTAQRDASGRLAEDLARQVVDDVLNLKW